jgi:hypothetical protein
LLRKALNHSLMTGRLAGSLKKAAPPYESRGFLDVAGRPRTCPWCGSRNHKLACGPHKTVKFCSFLNPWMHPWMQVGKISKIAISRHILFVQFAKIK